MKFALIFFAGLVVGSAGVYGWLLWRMDHDHTVTYRVEGQEGCHVTVQYGQGLGITPQVEGILPWETTVNLRGSEVARIINVQVQDGQGSCDAMCVLSIDGTEAMRGTLPACEAVVGRFW